MARRFSRTLRCGTLRKTRAAAGTSTPSGLDAATPKGKSNVVLHADIVVIAAGTLGSTEILLRSRANGLQMSNRLGRRFSANGDIIAFGYGATMPINAIGVGHPPKIADFPIGASVSGQIDLDDEDDLANEIRIQEGAMPSALAPILPVMFLPNGRLLGALQSLVSGVYKGPFAHLQTFFAVSHDSAAGCFKLEDDRLALSWPGAADEPVYPQARCRPGYARGQGGRAIREEPACRHGHGASARHRASARRLRHGPYARRRRRQPQGSGFQGRPAGAAAPTSMTALRH